MASVTKFLEETLKRRVNREKSAAAHVRERQFPGYRLLGGDRLTVAPQSWERMTARFRPPRRVARIIAELNSFLTGWILNFRLIDEWIRHKLPAAAGYRLKQLKRRGAMIRCLTARGASRPDAVMTASSGKGWWRLSQTPAVQQAMSIARLTTAGLISLTERHLLLRGSETAGCDRACPVV